MAVAKAAELEYYFYLYAHLAGCVQPAVSPGTPEHNPRLFDDVYTKVKSQIKRALTEEQMGRLMHADLDVLSEELQRVQAYFLLMFLFRGMPFIDLAHLRKRDVKDGK